MAIQNDNTLVTKGDLKELYTDKIAPYLGGGISYYQCDRSGEELKSCYASLDSNWSTSLANVPMIKRSGTIVQPSVGLFTIPAGSTVEIIYSHSASSPSGDFVMGIYNNTDSVWITNRDGANGLKEFCPYHIASGSNTYCMGDSYTIQWTNDTGHNVDISLRVNANSVPGSIREDYAGLSIKEIGRIVDPVKYVSNNSDLQETPVGNIISYMGNSVPKHYLACDGTLYNIGSYPELEAFIIDEFGSINYFGGDGASTWAVPDLRGEFLRGTGTNSHTNQGNGANVGVHQNATESTAIGYSYEGGKQYTTFTSAPDRWVGYTNPDKELGTLKLGTWINNFGGATGSQRYDAYSARPTNTSVKYCIKYESTFHAFFSNAAYKVEVGFTSGVGTPSMAVLDTTTVYGDASMINTTNNSLVAPMDGWYNLAITAEQLISKTPALYFFIYDSAGTQIDRICFQNGYSYGSYSGISNSATRYLHKGEQVRYGVHGADTAGSGRFSMVLLESNYNPTIVSANSVYSENEQMIGYWKDGKPLYQKTVTGTSGNKNSWNTFVTLNSDCDIKTADAYLQDTTPGWLKAGFSKGAVFDIFFHDNIFQTYVEDASMVNRPAFVILQYTKTTDTASILQIENSLLLNRPDLWEAGTEYHFGGGLYGIRKTGTIPSLAAGTRNDIVIKTDNSITKVISSGGSSTYSTWDYVIPYTQSTQREQFIWFNKGSSSHASNSILLYTRNLSNAVCEASTYDVWVLYKK